MLLRTFTFSFDLLNNVFYMIKVVSLVKFEHRGKFPQLVVRPHRPLIPQLCFYLLCNCNSVNRLHYEEYYKIAFGYPLNFGNAPHAR